MSDNVLIENLLLFLLQLNESKDVHEFIGFNRYGQPPISNNNEYKGFTDYWMEKILKWSQKRNLQIGHYILRS